MEQRNKLKKRLEWVDLTKGIAIMLVVIGHMLRGFTSSRMYIEYEIIFRYIDYIIYSFHMPLFFIISGVLYKKGKKINTIEKYLRFIGKKFNTLMIPYFIFSWIQIIIKLIMSNSVNNKVDYKSFINILFKPIEQFWFLYVLMIIFIIMPIIDVIINNIIKISIIALLFIIVKIIPINLGIVGTALYNLLYFYVGCIIVNIYGNLLKKNTYISLCIVYIIINFMVYILPISKALDNVGRIIMAIVGSLLVIELTKAFQYKENILVNVLKCIGKHSMAIYLLHIILASGIRIILVKLGVENMILHIALGLIFGVYIPIILDTFYMKVKILKNNLNL